VRPTLFRLNSQANLENSARLRAEFV